MLQAEFARTEVFDRPVAGRVFFEEVMRENLDMGRPGDPRVQALLAALLRFDLLPAGFRNRPTTVGQNSISGVAGGPRGGPRPATAGRMGTNAEPDAKHTREVTKGWHPDEQRWLERFRKTLAADYPETVKKALLFGSKARGDWTAESDIDVMVIVKDKAANSQERIAEMGEELVFSASAGAHPVRADENESEWAKGLSWGLAFHEAVEGEGSPCCEARSHRGTPLEVGHQCAQRGKPRHRQPRSAERSIPGYYAMMHAANAALAMKGLQPKTHKGTQTLFNEHLVQPGEVDNSAGETSPAASGDAPARTTTCRESRKARRTNSAPGQPHS